MPTGNYDISFPRLLNFALTTASLTGFASAVSGASWALSATSVADGAAHRVTIQNNSANNKSGINITVVGTDANGNALSETLTGPTGSATVTTTGYFATLTSVTPASTWGADTANIGWAAQIQTAILNINVLAEDALAVNVDIGGTINFTVEQTFDDLNAASPVFQTLVGAGSQTADGIWNTTGGATGLRVTVASYSGGATIRINANPTAMLNAPGAGGGGGGSGQDVDLVAIGGTAVVTAGVNGLLAVGGNVASAATDSGNPVKVGAKYNSGGITVTDGQRVDLQANTNGHLIIAASSTLNADDVTSTVALRDLTGTQRPLAVAGWAFDGSNWDRVRLAGNSLGLLVESGPYSFGRVTADGQIKGSSGFIHTITISPLTATPTAGLVTIYNSLTETGTVVYSEWVFATTVGHTVVLDVPCSTGIFVGFDGTLANVQVTVSYR